MPISCRSAFWRSAAVGAFLPARGDQGFGALGEGEQLGAVFGPQFRVAPGGERLVDALLRRSRWWL